MPKLYSLMLFSDSNVVCMFFESTYLTFVMVNDKAMSALFTSCSVLLKIHML